MTEELKEKLIECFDQMVVYKDLSKSNFFSALSLPSFLRDWLLKKFEDENGDYDIDEVSTFIKTYLPRKDDWVSIKNRIIYENERVKFLTKISVDISIKTQEITFSLPEFGLTNKETIIDEDVWQLYSSELIAGKEVWGIVELGYRSPDSYDVSWTDNATGSKAKGGKQGRIKLTKFTNFCPYNIDLEFYKDIRNEFNIHEWIDILLGAIDYNADGYESDKAKLTMLSRLLPFVEKRINLIELAPKGTGKSYLFGRISKYGNLTAGVMSRAKLFYDLSKRTYGLIYNNDYVAFDEIQKLAFADPDEMSQTLKGYMEQGIVSFGGHTGTPEAGIILLGNIPQDNMNEFVPMFNTLPALFRESALLDRFHGFIKGWDIPRMKESMKVCGWALNTAYFCEILHMLRDDVSYRAIVDELLDYDANADTRDVEAVKRIATGLLKLLFPNVRTAKDVDPKEFKDYCLRPALNMRGIVKYQMGLLDKEYRGKDVKDINASIRDLRGEDE